MAGIIFPSLTIEAEYVWARCPTKVGGMYHYYNSCFTVMDHGNAGDAGWAGDISWGAGPFFPAFCIG